jgi:Xaa-Pro aminopeptidase
MGVGVMKRRKKGRRPKFDDQLKRIIKTPKEIALLKKSAKISDSCIKVIERELRKPDITEKQLARAIDRQIKKQGAQNAFKTIVVSGKRAVYIHGKPTKARLRGLGYTDFGAKYKGYRTDVTVPFVKGDIGKEQQHILDTTLLAYKRMMKSIKIGQPCWELHDKFEKFLCARKYKVRHGLGHGIGLDIHELPALIKPKPGKKLGPRNKKRWQRMKRLRFEPNMVFTIEPGIYVKGVGGCRLENDVLLTRRGPQALTHSRVIKVL